MKNLPLNSNIGKINEFFKIPISFNSKTVILNEKIVEDLELINVIDPSSNNTPIYELIYQPQTLTGKKLLEQYPSQYTTDIKYLKDTQKLLQKYKSLSLQNSNTNLDVGVDVDKIIKLWDEIKNDTGFKDRYHYLDWPFWEFVNKSESLLQLVSLYNLASPVISLLIPIFILIIPFFIIQIKGITISFKEYLSILKEVAGNHSIGKLFTKFNSVKTDEKIYMLISSAFYLFSIYQNILTCIRFNSNMKKIHNYIEKLRNYIKMTENKYINFIKYTKSLKTYSKFNEELRHKMSGLFDIKKKLDLVTSYNISCCKINECFNKTLQLGTIMKYFYDIYCDPIYEDYFMYSFGFNGYIDNLEGIIDNINSKNINFTLFNKNKTKSGEKTTNKIIFKNAYHPSLINKNPIVNTIDIHKNLIITGPNASGKTTILKTSIINILISQQVGCGLYKSAKITPFKYIHCYLNIPDTSGRDSLFQAEARRCKDIVDIIQKNSKDTHFCAFDELYSGTNPMEAVSCASAFMIYLMTFPKVNCLLTTHFIELCKHLETSSTHFENYHMETNFIKDSVDKDFTYTYLLKKEISLVSGGIKVLKDMNYPTEIITNSLSNS